LLPPKQSTPDGSLLWILKSRQNLALPKNHELYDLVIDPNTLWRKNLVLPGTYYIETERDSLTATSKITKEGRSYLVYYGHNHFSSSSEDSLKQVKSGKTYTLYHTRHGILVKKGGQYKWVFISDSQTTGAPAKLRWASIGKVMVLGRYAFIEQNIRHREHPNLFILNIETGRLGRLTFKTGKLQMEKLFSELDSFKMPSKP
jgi:hypothetical protein